MLATLRGVTTLVAPTTLVTALLFYFGWARTSSQAFVMGLDESLFGYSTRDYILRSITSMFWPLFNSAVALVLGVVAHARLLAWSGLSGQRPAMRRKRERPVRLINIGIAVVGALLLVLGGAGSQIDRPSRFVSMAAPLAVTVGVVLLAYAAYLRQLVVRADGDPPLNAATAPLAPLAWGAVTVLVLLSSFWTVSHYAAIKGIDAAKAVVQRLPSQPSVTLYSAGRLHLSAPVVEEALPGEDDGYRYKYTDLKLLFRADRKLFLRPSDLDHPRNIVIAEDSGIRVEYS
jgi:hypothetical protein